MNEGDAIVVKEGSYRGWVGYFLRKATSQDDLVRYIVRIFDHEGNKYELNLPQSIIEMVEPAYN